MTKASACTAADDRESSAAWWPLKLLALWRYAVVAVVAAAVVVVVAKTMWTKLQVQRKELRLAINQGLVDAYVDTTNAKPPRADMSFSFIVLASNRNSGYASYSNVSVRIYPQVPLTAAGGHPVAEFNLTSDLLVPPGLKDEIFVQVEGNRTVHVPEAYQWMLYNMDIIEAVMRLEGDVVVYPARFNLQTAAAARGGATTTTRRAYYCWPITICYDNVAYSNDVSCEPRS